MQDFERLFEDLAAIGLASWRKELGGLLANRFSTPAHGDFPIWQRVLDGLPGIAGLPAKLTSTAISIPAVDGVSEAVLRDALLELKPWRKGPFDVCGVRIDAEWRSDMKWNRIEGAISPLDGRKVLDVGCGNGYYALRMRGSGARLVVGVDPTLLYVMQFLAVSHFMQPEPVHVLPVRLHELPADRDTFDTVFSMGVLYHQRLPGEHLRDLASSMKAGGELVLETLILPGTEAHARTPEGRYARMRNVWLLPTVPQLISWLESLGFENIRVVDITQTTTEEQRTTEWMPFESLAEALDPDDAARTLEGWPAPRRAVLICNRP
jgi:tRNA (mo5U34)-methyltransferase